MTITGASKPVSFALPTTTGGTQPVGVTCVPASGSAFALGTTAVICTATDASSRQAVCGFDVVAKSLQLSAKTFLAVGDSTTEGENGLPEPCPQSFGTKCTDTPNAYPVKLQSLFDGTFPGQGIVVKYLPHTGGNSTATTLNNLQGYLDLAHPDALLVLTGYNDLITPCHQGQVDDALCDQGIDNIEAGVRSIIRQARAYPGVRYVFVATLTPGRPGSRAIEPGRVQDANAHITGVVGPEGAVLVDLYPVFLGHESEYVALDGLHMNPPGYQAIAQTFFDKIVATVPQTNPQSFSRLNFRR